ncbi:hypothetical protein L195_g013757 [Trifolium pratense]|uniref:Uncharacterized protein n=1 Tax=Trifolium pratense TaxID=57577 RepID=A0A2K3PP40_TRIPR|nr:hypothetical protein L195_g013757 [Trifolium pratense]
MIKRSRRKKELGKDEDRARKTVKKRLTTTVTALTVTGEENCSFLKAVSARVIRVLDQGLTDTTCWQKYGETVTVRRWCIVDREQQNVDAEI